MPIHALRHILTPGTPVYGILKLGAVLLLFGLYMMRGRANRGESADSTPEAAPPAPKRPHPVSKKKRRSRKRRS